MINYNFSDEDIKKVERFIEIKNKGMYCDGAQITDVYNRVLGKHVNVTSCGSCLRARVSELENALNHYKASEAKKQEELDSIKEEVKEEAVKAGNNLKSKRKK